MKCSKHGQTADHKFISSQKNKLLTCTAANVALKVVLSQLLVRIRVLLHQA